MNTHHPIHDLLVDFTAWGRFARRWSDQTAYNYRLRCANADTWLRAQRTVALPDARRIDIETYLLARCRTPAGRNGTLQAIRALFRYLRTFDLADHDPTATIERLRQTEPLPRALTHWKAARLMAEARSDPQDAAMIAVMLHGALRREEVRTLRWDGIADGWLRFRAKGGKDHAVPMHPVVASTLSAWRALCPSKVWIFPSPAKPTQPVSTTTIAKRVRRLGDRIGEHVHPHRCRHTAATELVERGVDVRVIQKLLAHASLATTQRYLEARDARLVEAVAVLDYAG